MNELGTMRGAAEELNKLTALIAGLDRRGASLTVWMFEDHWEVSVETADPDVEQDDDYGWEGPDLGELLALASAQVGSIGHGPVTNGKGVPSPVECLGALQQLIGSRGLQYDFPFDLAYVPNSPVVPSEPWEVNITLSGGSEMFSGESLLVVLEEATKTLRESRKD